MRRWLVALVTGSVLLAGPAYAAWSDSTTVTTGSLGASTMVNPASVTCSGGGLLGSSLTFTWQHVALHYDYVVTVERQNGEELSSTPYTATGGVGSNQSVQLSYGLLSGLLSITTTFVVRVRSRIIGGAWVSSPGPTDTGTFTLGLATSC